MRYVVLGLLMLLIGAMAIAQPTPDPKTALKGEYAVMVKELNLPEAMQITIGGKVLAMQADVRAWDAQNTAKKQQLQNDLKAAETAKDAARLDQLRAQKRDMDAERAAIMTKYQKEIYGLLTPEQRATLVGVSQYQQAEYPVMATVLQLPQEKAAAIKQQVIANAIAADKWETANGETMSKLDQQIKDLQGQLAKLKTEREKLTADNQAAVNGLLTTEQQTAWAVYKLQQTLVQRFAKVKLTDEQVVKVKAICEEAVKAVTPIPMPGQRAFGQLTNPAVAAVETQVLTDEQRAMMKTK